MPTMALNMLFKTRTRSLRAVQTAMGVYLHANGVPTQVITLLSQYGISVGLDSLDTIMASLAEDQDKKLKSLGLEMTKKQLVIVYDNINIHEHVNQLRTDNQNKQFNGITGFLAKAVGDRPIPNRDSYHLSILDELDNGIFTLTEDDSKYYGIV